MIGNPPYVVVPKDNPYYKYKTYKSLDLYAYFYEIGLRITCPNGTLTYITPNLFIKTIKFETLRDFLEKNSKLIELKMTGDNVFNAIVPTCIVRLLNVKTNNWHFADMVVGNPVLCKMEKQIKLKDISNIQRGFEVGRDKVLPNGDYAILTGSTVQKFIPTSPRYITKSTYYEFAKDDYYYEGERLLLRETGSSLTVLYLEDRIFCNRSLYTIKIKDKDFNTKYVLGYLNSTLVQFYYTQKFKCETELFPKIRIAQAKQIPIYSASKKEQSKIISCVDRILSAKRKNSQYDTSLMEKEIDKIVYQLYDLSYEEVQMVDPNTTITKEEYTKQS